MRSRVTLVEIGDFAELTIHQYCEKYGIDRIDYYNRLGAINQTTLVCLMFVAFVILQKWAFAWYLGFMSIMWIAFWLSTIKESRFLAIYIVGLSLIGLLPRIFGWTMLLPLYGKILLAFLALWQMGTILVFKSNTSRINQEVDYET